MIGSGVVIQKLKFTLLAELRPLNMASVMCGMLLLTRNIRLRNYPNSIREPTDDNVPELFIILQYY